MVPLDYVLAVAVVVCPGGVDPGPSPEHQRLAPTVRDLALHWELLDPRERRRFFPAPDTFGEDLARLRARHRELADAPRAGEALRFPPRPVLDEFLAFNRAYRRNLAARRDAFGPAAGLDAVLAETDARFRVWQLVREAKSDCLLVTARRQALLALLDLVGGDDFYRGTLPPHVPVESFAPR